MMTDATVITPQPWRWSAKTGPRGNIREAVALFDTERDMQAAIYDLEIRGFDQAALSRPCSISEISGILGRDVTSMRDLEDDASVPRRAHVDAASRMSGLGVLIFLPIYVLLLAGIGVASANGLETWQSVVLTIGFGLSGAILGGLYAAQLKQRVDQQHRQERALGGYLLWVRTGNGLQDRIAVDVLKRHSGRDVHLHGPAD